MNRENRILVSTRKGAFCLSSQDGRGSWQMGPPMLSGWDVYHCIEDPRDPSRLYAAANHAVWGPRIARSVDGGRTWDEPVQSPAFAAEGDATVKAMWFVRPGHADRPGEVWAGVDPAALFRSGDWGATWEPVPAFNNHPTREYWQPGGGGLCLHGIVLDKTDPLEVIATVSSGGAYRSNDGGGSWTPINRGIRGSFMPDDSVPAGHCVHKLVRSTAAPNVLFQQNHCGMYRSDDAGDSWTEVTEGLPSEFGFPAAMHPRDPNTLFVAPLVGDSFRAFAEGAMAVWRSRDGGRSWTAMRDGLPQSNAYLASYRAAMATDDDDDAGVYIGTTTGHVFASRDEGDHWTKIGEYLPPVLAVEASVA